MAASDTSDGGGGPPRDLDSRAVRGLTQMMYVVNDVGPLAGADGMAHVYSEKGNRYTVDYRDGVCECEDYRNRHPDGGCKHLRRARYWLGLEPIPKWVQRDAVDDALLEAIALRCGRAGAER